MVVLSDKLDDHLVGEQWLAALVLGDEGVQPMLIWFHLSGYWTSLVEIVPRSSRA